MKFTAIAKAIFVLGILTTSAMITENQSVNAKGKYEKMNRLYDTNKLHQYYSGPSYELTSEKLSFDRMFDVMDSKQIKNIEVNLN
ncbi:hypothetical protein GBF94_09085 [Staphylococcus aureus]|nr:hypothetical protein [Staphylococcus aureus]